VTRHNFTLNQRPNFDRPVHHHNAINLGAFAHTSPDPGGVNEELLGRTDQGVAPACGDVVLKFTDFAQTFQRQLVRNLSPERIGVGALFGGEGEEAGPVELGRREELEQKVVVALRLTRVTEDERGAEGGPIVGGALTESVGWRAIFFRRAESESLSKIVDYL